MSARTLAAAPHSPALAAGRVFETGRSLSRRPRGGCEARVRCRTCFCWGVSTRGAATDGGGRLASRFLGGFRPRGTRSLCGSWRGLTGPWPCALVALLLGARRAEGPRGWGCWRSDGPVGLLLLFWVDDAGAWGRDATLRRANQVTTLTDRPPPLPTETCRYSAPAHLAPCRAAKSAAPAEKHAGESSADLRSAAPRN